MASAEVTGSHRRMEDARRPLALLAVARILTTPPGRQEGHHVGYPSPAQGHFPMAK
jgi:hypothetical protein